MSKRTKPYFQVPRVLADPDFIPNPMHRFVLIQLISRAAHKPKAWNNDGQEIWLEPGDVCISETALGQLTGCSRRVVRAAIHKGQATGMVRAKKGTTTKNNICLYSIDLDAVGIKRGTTNGQPTDNQRYNPIKERRRDGRDGRDSSDSENPSQHVRSGDRTPALEAVPDWFDQCDPDLPAEDPQPASGAQPPRGQQVNGHDTSTTPDLFDTPTKPDRPAKPAKPKTGYTEDFERLWQIWKDLKRGTAKQAAMNAWTAALKQPDVTAAMLISTAKLHADYWRASDRPPDKIPHASTWLRGKRWEDDIGTNVVSMAAAGGRSDRPATSDAVAKRFGGPEWYGRTFQAGSKRWTVGKGFKVARISEKNGVLLVPCDQWGSEDSFNSSKPRTWFQLDDEVVDNAAAADNG